MSTSVVLHGVALVRTDIPPKHRLLQKPHGVTSQETAFFNNNFILFSCWDNLSRGFA
jgi:hypothetical protein